MTKIEFEDLGEVAEDGQVADKPRGRIGRPRRDSGEPRLVSAEMARRLVAQARQEGLEVTGEAGLLQQMMKSVLEAALNEELTEHLGYEPGDPAGRGSGNSRNGTTRKTLLTESGPVELDTPRDREGSFEPQIVRKGQRRLDGIDKIVLGLYAKGMTVRDIQAHLVEIYDVDVSPDLISKITDAVHAEVAEWQSRPLERVYPVIFLDALVCKVRDGGSVKNKAAHLAVGINMQGRKEILGIWIETVEGAKFWLRVMNEIRSRGVEDVLIAVCDGLTGLPAAINAVWPQTKVQTCIVHLLRASLRWVNYKDRKRVAAALRTIYAAPTEAAARDALDALEDSEPRIPRHHPPLARVVGAGHPVLRLRPRRPTRHLHHQHDREHQLPTPQSHPQPRALPLRRSPDQGPLPRLQGDGPHQHPPHRRPQHRHRPLAHRTQPVRHHVPRPARTSLTMNTGHALTQKR
jgi:putative transposase